METLKSAGRGNTEGRGGLRVRNLLVGLEVGLSAALLVTAGLLIASLRHLEGVHPGFSPRDVVTFDTSLRETAYPEEAA